jgi:hypothetical protein
MLFGNVVLVSAQQGSPGDTPATAFTLGEFTPEDAILDTPSLDGVVDFDDESVIIAPVEAAEVTRETIGLTNEIGEIPQVALPLPPMRAGRSAAFDASVDINPEIGDQMSEVSAQHLTQGANPLRRGTPVAPRNSNPNLAININGLFGLDLYDLANHEERWYSFSAPQNNKISIYLCP